MHAVPVRGPDGKIVDFVDPRALQEEAAVEVATPPVEDPPTEADAEPPVRRTRALRSGERRPLSDLLGGSSTSPHPERSFTTGLVAGLLGTLIVAALIVASRVPATTPTATRSTASASTSAPTSVATARIVAMAAPPTVGRALVAYAAPAGAVVGAINADRAISLTGTFGSDWIQLQTADSGLVWVQTEALPSAVRGPAVLADLPNLAPPPTATALPAPTRAPVARPFVPDAPASAPAATAAITDAPVRRCTPDRVVAVVERGVTQVASCISLADAQSSLPNSTVVAADAHAAQADAAAQATALAQH